MDLDYDYLCKTVIVGDAGVGKSSLITRYSDGVFSAAHIPTVGVDFKIRTLTVDGRRVKTQLWDTAGQERFHSIVSSYYRGAHAIVLVYDVNSPETFEHLKRWLADVRMYASPHAVVLVVGNKHDSATQQLGVAEEEAHGWAETNGCQFMMASAKCNMNVDAAFDAMARQFLEVPKLANKSIASIQASIMQNNNAAVSGSVPSACGC